jgi:hypothetical protein
LLRRRWFRRTADGTYEVDLPDAVRSILQSSLDQLRDLLMADDPVLRRLFPPAYADNPTREKDYQAMMHGELIEARFAAIDDVEGSLRADVVDEATLTSWMQSINALRLVIGTALDISEDEVAPVRGDADGDQRLLYQLLTEVLAEILHALSGSLPPPTGDHLAPG